MCVGACLCVSSTCTCTSILYETLLYINNIYFKKKTDFVANTLCA